MSASCGIYRQEVESLTEGTADMTTTIALASAIFLILIIARHWNGFTMKDLGAMSPRWLAEHNSEHR
jgi:hypothetical protein